MRAITLNRIPWINVYNYEAEVLIIADLTKVWLDTAFSRA